MKQTITVTAILSDARFISAQTDGWQQAAERSIEWADGSWHTSNGKFSVIAVFMAPSDGSEPAKQFDVDGVKAFEASGEAKRADESYERIYEATLQSMFDLAASKRSSRKSTK